MQHSWKAEGFGVVIRPVRMDDAEFIVWLRNLEHTKGKLGDSAVGVAEQEAWLRTYFDRRDDVYFLVETPGGRRVGTHGLSHLTERSAEAGRLIMRLEVPAAVPTSLITFDLAFNEMGLKELTGTSVSTNEKVHLLTEIRFPGDARGEGRADDRGAAGGHRAFCDDGGGMGEGPAQGVIPIAKYAEKQILAWDKAQKS